MAQALVLALGGMLAIVLNALSGGALHSSVPSLTRQLLDLATKRLPEDQRERFAEEWQSHINEVSGDLGKIVFALGCVSAAQNMTLSRVQFAPRGEQQYQDTHSSLPKVQTPKESSQNRALHGIAVACYPKSGIASPNYRTVCERPVWVGRCSAMLGFPPREQT